MKEGVQKIVFAEQSRSSWSLQSKLLKGETVFMQSREDLLGNSFHEFLLWEGFCEITFLKTVRNVFQALRGASSLNPSLRKPDHGF